MCKKNISEEVEKFIKVLKKRLDIFAKKNSDYGSSFRIDGLVGIVLRLGDKLMRLKQTSKDGHTIQVKDEGLRELFLDIGNYTDMGLMLLEESCEEEDSNFSDESFELQQGSDYSI
jgi:hypothetical protein